MIRVKSTALAFATLILCLSANVAAKAQWTVYDPTVYAEELENYGQLYQSNAQLYQSYTMFSTQFTPTSYLNSINTLGSGITSTSRPPLLRSVDPNGQADTPQFTAWQAQLTNAHADSTGGPAAINGTTRTLSGTALSPSTTQGSLAYTNYQLSNGLTQTALASIGQANVNNQLRAGQIAQLQTANNDSNDQTAQAVAQHNAIATVILAQAQVDTENIMAANLQLQMQAEVRNNNNAAEQLQNQSNMVSSQQAVDHAWVGSGSLQSGYNTLTATTGTQVQ